MSVCFRSAQSRTRSQLEAAANALQFPWTIGVPLDVGIAASKVKPEDACDFSACSEALEEREEEGEKEKTEAEAKSSISDGPWDFAKSSSHSEQPLAPNSAERGKFSGNLDGTIRFCRTPYVNLCGKR